MTKEKIKELDKLRNMISSDNAGERYDANQAYQTQYNLLSKRDQYIYDDHVQQERIEASDIFSMTFLFIFLSFVLFGVIYLCCF